MKRTIYIVVDWRHPSGVELLAGDLVSVEQGLADQWHEMGIARVLGLPGSCRFCGCTQDNACIGDDEEPCHWVEADVCSSCIWRKQGARKPVPSVDELKLQRDGTLFPADSTLRPVGNAE